MKFTSASSIIALLAAGAAVDATFTSRSQVAQLPQRSGWLLGAIRGGSMAIEEDEEKPVKKSSKKKKKKKAASKPKDDKPADLSMAILGGSSDRNTMNVFSYSSDEGHTVVGMTEGALEEMGLFEGDTVSIKGKRGKKTMASVAVLDESDITALSDGSSEASAIGMSVDAMRNAGVRAGDKVTVVPAPNVKFGKAVLVLPTAESLKLAGIEDMEEANLFEDYLKPYFQGKFRTLYRGDSFHIDSNKVLKRRQKCKLFGNGSGKSITF